MPDCIKCNKRPAKPGEALCAACAEAAYGRMGVHLQDTKAGYFKTVHQNKSYEPLHLNKGKVRVIAPLKDQTVPSTRSSGTRWRPHRPEPTQKTAPGNAQKTPVTEHQQNGDERNARFGYVGGKSPYCPRMTKQPWPMTVAEDTAISKPTTSLKPTQVYHAVTDLSESSNVGIIDSLISLYLKNGYRINTEGDDRIKIMAINDDDSQVIILCNDYVPPHSVIEALIAMGARQNFIIMRARHNQTVVSLNLGRIGRILGREEKNGQSFWLIFTGEQPHLVQIQPLPVSTNDMALYKLMLSMLTIKKTMVEEGKLTSEKALDELQEEIRQEIASIPKRKR